MVSFEQLNNEQKEAVISNAHYLRIIAGAGSGKTRVLTMRIAHLMQEKHVSAHHILAITFTNKAASEMKKRIQKMLPETGNGCWISTIHSLCVRILSEDIEALGYPRNFTIADSDDQRQILKEAYKLLEVSKNEYSYSSILDYIGGAKAAGIEPEEALKIATDNEEETIKAKIYQYYTKRLQQIYGLDFDDLILWTLRLFNQFPIKKEKWAKRFHYVLVDEFQDIDHQQYQLIKDLVSVHQQLCVVGDPDQTIYTWRGADVDIIMHFEKDFPSTQTIILNRNYRSTNNILSGANSLIQNNRNRIAKNLFSAAGEGEKILHKSLASEEGEAYFVASKIIEQARAGMSLCDMAILYRSNYLSRTMEKVLIENRIPYIIYGGIRFYERSEVKDILSYLRLITHGDDLAFLRTINTPRRGIGNATIERLRALASAHGLSMYEVIQRGLYTKNTATFQRFVKMVENWKSLLRTGSLINVFHAVLDDSGYRDMLTKDNETERLENVKSLLDDIQEYSKNYPESSLEEYLQMISLYTDKASDNSQDAVNLLTIHAAKGLEFDTVFVIGLSEGVFPSDRSLTYGGLKGLEEERRLAYVAYTRAKKQLILSDNRSFSYVTKTGKCVSRFVNEIDPSFLEELNKQEERNLFKDSSSALLAEKGTALKATDTSTLQARKNSSLHKGDLVEHAIFGKGVVLKKEDRFVTIAFAHPHGTRKILADHPSLHKV